MVGDEAQARPLRLFNELDNMLLMGRYLKKQIVVDAVQWFRHGDHPAVMSELGDKSGHIDTPEGRLRVEPGDWVITGVAGEHYPCKPDIFAKLYTAAD
jgi:hypothetical protein